MALYTHADVLASLLKPKANPADQPETEDWADRIAKAKEARRSGQKMRAGKPPVISKTWKREK